MLAKHLAEADRASCYDVYCDLSVLYLDHPTVIAPLYSISVTFSGHFGPIPQSEVVVHELCVVGLVSIESKYVRLGQLQSFMRQKLCNLANTSSK